MIAFPEEFLHYVWKLKLFDLKKLTTTDGLPIRLLDIGAHNHHAGPDFTNARIKIGPTQWAGSVEIHKKSSDWIKHQHQEDAAYNNTILHVVYEHDKAIRHPNGDIIPTLELKDRIPSEYIKRYWQLLNNKYWVPCQPQVATNSQLTARLWMWMDRLVVERLERKTATIQAELQQTQNNWEEAFYRILARNFGVKQNTAPFEALAKSLPLLTLAKHKHNLMQLEALLLGQAGFLEEAFEEDYLQQLQGEYRFLRKKYQLHPLKASSWKFARMRPAAFPTIRLAQFAQLIHQSTHLFSKLLEATDVKALKALFDVQIGGYWDTHYRLGQKSRKRKKSLGKGTVDLILINTVAPVLFVYGQAHGSQAHKERAIELLNSLSAEKNSIITKWDDLGLEAKNAFDSQALLQLKKYYCDQKRCLECAIGHKIIQTKT